MAGADQRRRHRRDSQSQPQSEPEAESEKTSKKSAHETKMSAGKRTTEIGAKFREICQQLNVDPSTADRAFDAYSLVTDNYSLPGDPLHWVGLALYVSCRSSFVPTVGQSDNVIEGNCVSLTKLLSLCNLSLSEFFNKIKNWMDMTSVADEFRKKIEKLERNFFVSAVLFKELQSVFYDIFVPTDPSDIPKPSKSNKKLKTTPCTSGSLFEFTWCLFICVKGEFPLVSDDLVNMYHIFLCCLDFIFSNAFMAHRKDIINPKFEALPSNWSSPKYKNPEKPPCIIKLMCQKHHGTEVDVKIMKQYKFKSIIENFFQKQFLKGDTNTLLGLIDPINFANNLKSLNKMYGTFMLSVGEFDERIILGDSETELKITDDEISKAIKSYEVNKKNTFFSHTPLSGREHLNHKNDFLTPVSNAFQSLEKLNSFLFGRSNSPSQGLIDLFAECTKNPMADIIARQKKMGAQFLLIYASLTNEDIAGDKLNLIEVLYYRLLEDLVKEEQRRKPHIKVEWLFVNELFHKALFSCCTEIILMYNTHHSNSAIRFPWVLDCYSLDPFHFCKIIELIVIIVKERLSRDTIKHLNAIEEHVLESLAWKSTSQLWVTLNRLEGPVPGWVDVRIENNSTNNKNTPNQMKSLTVTVTTLLQSPTIGYHDQFLATILESPAKKQLFKDDAIKPGQSLLNHNTPDESKEVPTTSNVSNKVSPPHKKGSSLFFRKFYSLAYIRLQNLCSNLRLEDENLISKIWTLFEQVIIQHTYLMKDRHLDQILMCTIYAMCKVFKSGSFSVEKTFREIMRCYKLQPQADSRVYRDVLLRPNIFEGDDNENISPTAQNQTSNSQIRGDLITFYNNVYIIPMRELVFRIGGTVENAEHSLSPLPEVRRGTINGGTSTERHRVSDYHHLYVSSLMEPPSGDSNVFTYRFERTSTSAIHDINYLISQEIITGRKRTIHESDGSTEKKYFGTVSD